MSATVVNHESIARRHGVELSSVAPRPKSERLSRLAEILDRDDVPYRIAPDVAQSYYERAESGQPFAIGSLTGQTIDLGQYADVQRYDSHSVEDHLSWACLVADQQSTKHRYACREYLEGETMFEIGGSVIPDYYLLNARIYQQTGWQLATVNMIIPAHLFFSCHSKRFFPVTTFMRPLEQDYLEEPDIGHDVAGHVATFTISEVAEVMNNHGLANDMIHRDKMIKLSNAQDELQKQQIEDEASELLLYAGRLYWFTVEFGLVQQSGQLRAFGAGILSSPGETRFSVESPESNRVLIDPRRDDDLLRLVATDYLISEYQKTYFVLNDFASLRSLTPERILHLTHAARELPHYTWRELAPGDNVVNVGRTLTSANEKYYRLLAGQALDECLRRTALRNLRMFASTPDLGQRAATMFKVPPPEIPPALIEQFLQAEQQGQFTES
jgi:phenylalanine-4-hydroxylase